MRTLTTSDRKDYIPNVRQLTGIQKKQTPIGNAKARLSGVKLTKPAPKKPSLKQRAEAKLQGIGAKARKSYTTVVKKARSTPAYKKKVERARYEGRM